jgi:hypothetical protein
VKPIIDKAEVSIDFPDKTYIGSFSRESGFEVRTEPDAILLKLVRPGEERREVSIHLHYYLLADILKATADAMADHEPLDDAHTEQLREGADALSAVIGGRISPSKTKPKKH